MVEGSEQSRIDSGKLFIHTHTRAPLSPDNIAKSAMIGNVAYADADCGLCVALHAFRLAVSAAAAAAAAVTAVTNCCDWLHIRRCCPVTGAVR